MVANIYSNIAYVVLCYLNTHTHKELNMEGLKIKRGEAVCLKKIKLFFSFYNFQTTLQLRHFDASTQNNEKILTYSDTEKNFTSECGSENF